MRCGVAVEWQIETRAAAEAQSPAGLPVCQPSADGRVRALQDQKGFTVWLTGLSGSGKTAIAKPLESALRDRGLNVERLDGDIVRQSLTSDLGFTKEDRDQNIKRVTFVAKLLTRNGVAVICAFISPYRERRARTRMEIEEGGAFVEVFVECPLEAVSYTHLTLPTN